MSRLTEAATKLMAAAAEYGAALRASECDRLVVDEAALKATLPLNVVSKYKWKYLIQDADADGDRLDIVEIDKPNCDPQAAAEAWAAQSSPGHKTIFVYPLPIPPTAFKLAYKATRTVEREEPINGPQR